MSSVKPVLLCLSHLRWNFVFQRPQHLMTRALGRYDVIFFEEPIDGPAISLRTCRTDQGLLIATPVLPVGLSEREVDDAQRMLLDDLLATLPAAPAVLWFYTPMALAFTAHLKAAVTVFDSMDELSGFDGASDRLLLLERRLLRRTDLVFTGGRSLHAAKMRLHANVHLFPSSVDAAHFRQARVPLDSEPSDQACLPRPRLGFFGVVDERMDVALVDDIAQRRPDWQIVMIGPVVKIDASTLPRRPNIHWLGIKRYDELPGYIAGWDVALMPFALNAATRFISPTKTPEYLAAGVPVISTAVTDVVQDWGDGCVEIAADGRTTVAAAEMLFARPRDPWLAHVDRRMQWMSWNATWVRMARLVAGAAEQTRSGSTDASTGSEARLLNE